MPGYHRHIVIVQRFVYRLSNGRRRYGPFATSLVFRREGIGFSMLGMGCYVFESTSAHDWRLSTVYESDYHWGTVPFVKNGGGYRLCDSQVFADIYKHFRGSPIGSCPEDMVNPMAFLDRFSSPMSNGQYREMYIMANYNGKVDFYVRTSTDFPADAYEQLEGDVDDPSL